MLTLLVEAEECLNPSALEFVKLAPQEIFY